MPRITVITAAFNCSQTLQCALASLCDQTFTDFEAWVVGDCCTDDSEQVVASFRDPRLHWTNLTSRFGSQSGPNNEGLRRAAGEYIAYLGQDDLWFPSHLASLLDKAEQTDSDFIHATLLLAHPTLPPQGIGAPMSGRFNATRFVPPSGWLLRRSVLEVCGPWPTPHGLIGGVDFVLQKRACLAGFRFVGSGRLTVIKFPSAWWGTYARRQDYPQRQYLARMKQDPARLLTDLLTDLTLGVTRSQEEMRIRPALRATLRAIYWKLVNWYGPARWPLSQWFIWRHARTRRKSAVLRGLAPQPPAKS